MAGSSPSLSDDHAIASEGATPIRPWSNHARRAKGRDVSEIQVLLVTVRGGFMWVSRHVRFSAGLCLCVMLALWWFPLSARGAGIPERKTVALLYPDPRLLPEAAAVE